MIKQVLIACLNMYIIRWLALRNVFVWRGLMVLSEIVWYDSIDSTNSELKSLLSEGKKLPCGYTIAALEQTAGRGRLDRKWLSGIGENLTFSTLIISEQEDLMRFMSLPMFFALAIADFLKVSGVDAKVKWPNDVLVGDKKICGILSENSGVNNGSGISFIVGVGLNVNMSADYMKTIDRPATSLFAETGSKYDVKNMLPDILDILQGRLALWEGEGFSAIREEWIFKSGGLGKQISVHREDKKVSGIIHGYGEYGELLLEDSDGRVSPVWSGDISF